MPFFQYKAVTPDGKLVEGTLQAADRETALNRLHEQGQLPVTVSSNEDTGFLGREFVLPWKRKRVAQKDLLVFTQELTTLLGAGLPLDRSLGILSSLTENEYLREITRELLREIKGGRSLSESLGMYPQVFPKVYVSMIRAGEVGGTLNQILERLVEYLESAQELRDYLISSLIYPIILTIVGLASVVIMVLFVIPNFSVIFENAGAPVPLPMAILLGISSFLSTFWWVLLLAVLAALIFVRKQLREEEKRLEWDRRLLALPLIGDVLRKLEISRFSRTLGTLLNSAVPLIQSITIVRDIVGNRAVAAAVDPIKAGVKKGEGLAEPVRRSEVFPTFAVHLLEVGEETGRLDDMLIQIADTYDRELRTSMKRLVALFEPAVILTMGLIIGVMVVSMLYSILSINDVPL